MDDKFSIALEMAIEGNGLTPKTFSEKIGVSGNAVLKWIKEDSFPRPDKWQGIKQHSGVDPQKYVDYATGEKGVMAPTQTTTGGRAAQNNALGGNTTITMDESGITCTGLDERNPPSPQIDTDEWAELLYWIRRYPTLFPGMVKAARDLKSLGLRLYEFDSRSGYQKKTRGYRQRLATPFVLPGAKRCHRFQRRTFLRPRCTERFQFWLWSTICGLFPGPLSTQLGPMVLGATDSVLQIDCFCVIIR